MLQSSIKRKEKSVTGDSINKKNKKNKKYEDKSSEDKY